MGRFVVPANAVVVPPSMAGTLLRALEQFAAAHRRDGGTIDADWLALMTDVSSVAAWWRQQAGAECGTKVDPVGAVGVESPVMSVDEAARRSGLSARAITRACVEKRLPARRMGRAWILRTDDVDSFATRARRTAQ